MANKTMIAVLGASMMALAGCDDAKRTAESMGIIGGDDGPTAVWITTRMSDKPLFVSKSNTNDVESIWFDENGNPHPISNSLPRQSR